MFMSERHYYIGADTELIPAVLLITDTLTHAHDLVYY